jgi:hypothetical protein
MTTKTNLKDKVAVKPIVDFMPHWKDEERCFAEAKLRDARTKKLVEGGWPRQKPTNQATCERWLSNVVNQDTGEFHMARNNEGIPDKTTGAKYIVTVITRIRDSSGKNEYLYTKGKLEGFNASARPEIMHIAKPETWSKTEFAYDRTYEEKTGSFTVSTTGPSKTYEVYDIPYSADNVKKLYDKTEDENVSFVLKDIKTGDARSVNWSSVKDSLDLFCNKSFDYLWKADYMPAPVKQELRQEAIAQGLIGGMASDYSMPGSGPRPGSGTAGVK